MKRILAPLFLLGLLGAAPAAAAGHLQIEKLTDSIYVVRPLPGDNVAVSNAGFVILPDRVLVFDTLSDRELMQEMMGLILKVTSKPVSLVVVSHWHADHTGGLDYFATRPYTLYSGPGTLARIEQVRKERRGFLEKKETQTVGMARREADPAKRDALDGELQEVRRQQAAFDRLPPIKPGIEVSRHVEIAPGGRVSFISFVGPGHTSGDILLHLVDDKILFTGDLLEVQTVPNLADAYTQEWIARLEEMQQMNVDRFVPGHGPVGTKEDLRALQTYLEKLTGMVRPIARDGSERDLVEKLRLPPPFDLWAAPELWFTGAQRVFREMRGLVPPPPYPAPKFRSPAAPPPREKPAGPGVR